jgi:SAM-dependent methyltransferase
MNADTEARPQRGCPACGQVSHVIHVPPTNGYSIVQCKQCGLIFCDPMPDAAALEEFYAHYAPAAVENGPQGAETIRSQLLKEAQRLGHNDKFGDLLDVGCGYGFFLKSMQGLCRSVTGVELSAEEAVYAGSELGLKVHHCTLEEARFPDSCFDCVTMWDVIEHLSDPMDHLQQIWRILKPGGLLVLSTPNACCLTARLTRGAWRLWAPPEHLYYFCLPTMKRMCFNAGFRIESAFTFGIDFYHLYVWLRNVSMSRGELLCSSYARVAFDRRLRRMRVGWLVIRLINLASQLLFRHVALGDSMHVYSRKGL